MRVAFYASKGKKFDETLARSFCRGLKRAGAGSEILATGDWKRGLIQDDADVAVVVGVKNVSGPIFKAYRAAGKHAVFIDKGYTRLRGGPLGTLYWRVSVDDFQPLAYFQKVKRPPERWEALRVPIHCHRPGETVLFAGSSQKFCLWHDLGPATAYAEQVLAEARQYTKREIIYRPKPSWKDAVPIAGYAYSAEGSKFSVDLERAHCLVTYGSNACFEALINGVPTIVLGDGITRPLSFTKLCSVEHPLMPAAGDLYQLACDLAYCQYTLEEMANGLCWATLRPLLECA